jgi:hypothetical protein
MIRSQRLRSVFGVIRCQQQEGRRYGGIESPGAGPAVPQHLLGGVSEPLPSVYYEIRVEGVLDNRWATWFDNLAVAGEGDHTVISGPLVDQSALHGVLARVRDLGMSLISVQRLGSPGLGETVG